MRTAPSMPMVFKREGHGGHADGVGTSVTLPARTVLVAAGTTPNITCEKEAPNTFQLDEQEASSSGRIAPSENGDGRFHVDAGSRRVLHVVRPPAGSSRTTATTIRATPATSSRPWRRRRTATAGRSSCLRTRSRALDPARQPARDASWRRLVATLDDEFTATRRGRRPPDADHRRSDREGAGGGAAFPSRPVLSPAELRDARAARRARTARDIPLLMEGIALTGAWVDREKGLLSLIALEMGVSSRLCAYLQQGEPVDRDGTDRHADRDSRKARTCCCSAAALATPCCSRSRRRCATAGTR